MPLVQNATIQERQDKQLQGLADGQLWKQALSLIDKRMKKGDKSDLLLAKKIRILFACPDQLRKQQGRKELDALLDRKVAITDLEALGMIAHDDFKRIYWDPRIVPMWERATDAQSQDEDIVKAWFHFQLYRMDWKGAQKAAMKYMKNFPGKRAPFFWSILCSHLAGASVDASDGERKLFPALAYKLLSKAAADVPAEQEILSQGRVLHTLEELFLLLRVYRSQGKHKEALEVLIDPRTGINSRVGRSSWELVRELIELYALTERWSEEWLFCSKLLQDAQPDNLRNTFRPTHCDYGKFGDDWKVWAGLVDAAHQIGSERCLADTTALIESFIDQDTSSRNARLAEMKFYSLSPMEDKDSQDRLLSCCWEYFSDYSSKVVCFRDLHPYLSCLDTPKQEEFLILAAKSAHSQKPDPNGSESITISWITSEMNALKLDYYLVVSRDDNLWDTDLLNVFVCNCLRLYNFSLSVGSNLPASERQPGDDAAILAAMALIRLHRGGHFPSLLRSIVILESLGSYSSRNYDAILILVRLYMFLGAGSLATLWYKRLSIKNLQHATLSWILFTRISTIYPLPVGLIHKAKTETTVTDCSRGMVQAIDWHGAASKINDRSMRQMLAQGHYSMILDNIPSTRLVREGFSKFLLIVELKRVERLARATQLTDDREPCVNHLSESAQDYRDITAFPDCEAPGQLRFEEHLNAGPRPNNQWLAMQLRMIRFWDMLNGVPTAVIAEQVDRMRDHNHSEPNSMTQLEFEASGIVGSLEEIYLVYRYKNWLVNQELAAETTRRLLTSIECWHRDCAEFMASMLSNPSYCTFPLSLEIGVPNWDYLHNLYGMLDICQFTIPTLTYIINENHEYSLLNQSWLGAQTSRIVDLTAKIVEDAREVASRLQRKVHERIATDALIATALGRSDDADDTVGLELRKLVDVPSMEDIGTCLQESWCEALGGIIMVKASADSLKSSSK